MLTTEDSCVFFSAAAGDYVTIRVYGDFTIVTEEVKEDLIYDIFAVPTENSRSVVCFTKTKELKASGFRVFGDGQLLAETENSPESIQTVEVGCRPKDIEIIVVS